MRAAVQIRIEMWVCAGVLVAEHCDKAIRQFSPMSTPLGWAAGLRQALGSPDEKIFEAATEIE
jgi:hypothetical protein